MSKKRSISKGDKFGLLTAIEPTDKPVVKGVAWLCKCDCGNYIEIASYLLYREDVHSCGCLRKEIAKEKLKKIHPMLFEKIRSATIDTPATTRSGTGIRNIFYRESKGFYVLTIERKGIKYLQNFKTLEEALEVKKIVLDRYLSGDPEWYKKE